MTKTTLLRGGRIFLLAGLMLAASVSFAQVSFTVDNTDGCAPLTVTFTNTSSNGDRYFWNFDDGPGGWSYGDTVYTFTQARRYRVRLSAFDTAGSGGNPNNYMFQGSYEMEITVYGVTNIYTSSNPACLGEELRFFSDGQGLTSVTWDFGDSSAASNQFEPFHAYSDTGTYLITFIATSQCGTDTITRSIDVDTNATPNANFQVEPYSGQGCPNDNFRFRLYGTASANTTYEWDMGDGTIIYGQEFNYSYSDTGTYIVVLAATNVCGNTTLSLDTIRIIGNAPFGNIGLDIPPACKGDPFQYYIWGSGGGGGGPTFQAYYWTFGDGKTDSVQFPNHTYSDTGNYNVTVTITNGCGNDTTLKTTAVVDTNVVPNFDPQSFGTPNDGQGIQCPGDSVLFYFAGTGDIFWDFGDGDTAHATNILIINDPGVLTYVLHAYKDTGTYVAKVTLTNGCGNSKTDSMIVVVGDSAQVNGGFTYLGKPGGGNYNACENIDFIAIGGIQYVWIWGDGDTTITTAGADSHTYASPGTYQIDVIISNSCGNSATVSEVITIDGMQMGGTVYDLLCNGTNSGEIDVEMYGGVLPYTYSWSNGATTQDLINIPAGSYTITVTDANGCTYIDSIDVLEPSVLGSSTTNTPSSSCGGVDGTATVTASGGVAPYTYSWSTIPPKTTAIATGLSAGGYTVTVTDNNGCTKESVVNINDTGAPSASVTSSTNLTCNKVCIGQATASATGGASPYTYSWNTTPAQTTATATGLCAQTYNVTITDASGCAGAASVTITEPAAVTMTFTSKATACNQSNGTATLSPSGGTSPYTYVWSTTPVQTASIASGLSPGMYTATVTDSKGCTGASSVLINVAPSPSLSTTVKDASCLNSANGSATVNATAGTSPYSYSWNTVPVQNAMSATGLTAGTYTATVTDANGCTATQSVMVKQPTALVPVTAKTDAKCNGEPSGSATVNVTGGTPTYNYSWSTLPPLTTAQAPAIKGGTYTVTVTDANGCSATATAVVAEPPVISPTTGSTPSSACGNIDGSASVLTTTGGVAPYTYQWNTTPTQNGTTATGLSAGGYVVTITDANGCTKTAGVNVNDTGAPTATTSNTNTSCNKVCDAAATVTPSGGVSPYTYSWSNTKTTQIVTGLCAGNLTVTVTDNAGCKTVKTVTVSEPAPVKPVITKNGDTLTSSVGVTYQWSFNGTPIGGATNQKYTITQNGKYIVTITDGSGCTGSSDTLIVINVGVILAQKSAELLGVYPNPFGDHATVSYSLSSSSLVTIEVYNLLGERTAVIEEGVRTAGNHTAVLTTETIGMKQGIYFLKFKAGDTVKTIRIVKTY